MTDKTEALRLAEWIESDMTCDGDAEVASELRRLSAVEAQRGALLEALKKAVEDGCANAYATEGDVCGERGCCGVVSYKPHADDCWVTTARAAIKAVEEQK